MWTVDQTKVVTAAEKAAAFQAATLAAFTNSIVRMMDAAAQSRRYDSALSLSTYVTSTNATWAEEATAFVAWRDAVWTYAYAELSKVQTGARSTPTIDEFLAELPPIAWPT